MNQPSQPSQEPGSLPPQEIVQTPESLRAQEAIRHLEAANKKADKLVTLAGSELTVEEELSDMKHNHAIDRARAVEQRHAVPGRISPSEIEEDLAELKSRMEAQSESDIMRNGPGSESRH